MISRKARLTCVGVLVVGAAIWVDDLLFTPKDQVIYLWPLLVVPAMFIAGVTLAAHIAAAVFVRFRRL